MNTLKSLFAEVYTLDIIDRKKINHEDAMESRFEVSEHEIANMDEFDYCVLILEGRIIQAS